MKTNFILSFFLIFSCSSVKQEAEVHYEVTEQPQQYIKEIAHTAYILDKANFLRFSFSEIDSITGEWFKYLTYFSQKNNLSEQIISKTDLSDGFYGDTLLFYKNNISDKQVIIWKQEGEYWSYLNIFLFYQGNIALIGDLSIGLDCKNCDSFNFPQSGIDVLETDEFLKIRFKEQAVYRGSISQGNPYNSINVKTDKLTLFYEKTRSYISY